MRGTVLTLILALFAVSPALADTGGDPWIRVDSIVAVIGQTPVLESEILMESDLGLLTSPVPGGGFAVLLEAYLNRLLILREVDEVGGFRLTAGQAEGAYRGYLQRYENESLYREKLRAWGIGEAQVQERLSRALLASLYTESRIQFFVNVLPSDIEEAYEREPERWGGASIYDVWETIRSELLSRSYARERERWLKTLRERYDLVVYGRPEGSVER